MSRRAAPQGQAPPAQSRQNEYFVPRDGIDREVITADICRYLGNDALVRPGTYDNPTTGQVIQGYFINAYRNLTTAMIEDLKADSARWDQERRQHSARSSTSGVQYRNSETHSSRQYYGPSDNGSGYPQDSRDQYADSAPRYPGTGSAGYTGASGGSFAPQGFGSQGGYGGPQSYQQQSPPHTQQPASMQQYPTHSSMSQQFVPTAQYGSAFQDVGANNAVRGSAPDISMGGYNDSYGRDTRGAPVSTMPHSQARYVTSGPSAPQGFPTSAPPAGFYTPNPASGPLYGAQPLDPFAGRGPAGYQDSQQQYDTTPAPSRTPTSTSGSAAPPASSSSSHRRDRDRSDRESVERLESRHGHRHGSRRT